MKKAWLLYDPKTQQFVINGQLAKQTFANWGEIEIYATLDYAEAELRKYQHLSPTLEVSLATRK